MFLFHPSDSTLQTFLDGQMKDAQRRTVASHLESCEACLLKIEQLQAAWVCFQKLEESSTTDEALDLSEGLRNILAMVHRWQMAHTAAEPDSESTNAWLRTQLSQELEVYLGRRTTGRIIQDVSDSEFDACSVMSKAGLLLTAFLGRQTAAKIQIRIQQVIGAKEKPDNISQTSAYGWGR